MTRAGGTVRKVAGRSLGNRLLPARFLVFLLLLPAGFAAYRFALPGPGLGDALAMSFDFAALVFLGSLVPLLRDCDAQMMRDHSQANDANRVLVLLLTTVLALVVLGAISGELAGAQHGAVPAMAKLVGTLLLIWLFSNTVYALHYAHAFYAQDAKHGGDTGGLDFPGTKVPDYWDFAYFAFTLGMTFQTSDVAVTLSSLRKIMLLHCFAAFVFNIGVIAFTINALGGGS